MPTIQDDPSDRCISNHLPIKELAESPSVLLLAALDKLVADTPPLTRVSEQDQFGLFGGYIGISGLLLQLSTTYPDLKIQDQSLKQWAELYLGGERDATQAVPYPLIGLVGETVCLLALRACLSDNKADCGKFLASFDAARQPIPEGEEDEWDPELLQGRAGALYLLRLVRKWVPASKEKIDECISDMAERLMQANDYGARSWRWKGRMYTGAVHGDIGNITQLVLSKPDLAPRVEVHLKRLLEMQFEDGGWPLHSNRDEEATTMVQLCHGATGFVYSLQALRPYFPNLQDEIDAAIKKGQSCIWEKGLLKKEPSLCHGTFGNGL